MNRHLAVVDGPAGLCSNLFVDVGFENGSRKFLVLWSRQGNDVCFQGVDDLAEAGNPQGTELGGGNEVTSPTILAWRDPKTSSHSC